MADELAILKKGPEAWNAWCREQSSSSIGLRGADLIAANLRGANLGGANLRGANLIAANLSGGDLSGANLGGANLGGANLGGANLRRANLIKGTLIEATLSGANLRGADLRGGDLSGANLFKADLGGANFFKANLGGANLGGAYLHGANLSGANLRGADLSGANLNEATLGGANLNEATLSGADLFKANLGGANLGGANLFKANLSGAILRGANLSEADLGGAILRGANLSEADLHRANLSGADLQRTDLVGTCLARANLTGCFVYGMSAWDLNLVEATQKDLVITKKDQPEITVDNLEVAQFIYLLLHNEKIRDVIDTIGKKAVLILGRFSAERKPLLDALRETLRGRNLLPIVFDFSIPAGRNVTETVKVLASLARFVVADVTDATEVRVELHHIVPNFPSLPVQPILLRGQGEFDSLPGHLAEFPWVLPTFRYEGQDHLLANLDQGVIEPAEAKVKALEERRRAIEAELAKPS